MCVPVRRAASWKGFCETPRSDWRPQVWKGDLRETLGKLGAKESKGGRGMAI